MNPSKVTRSVYRELLQASGVDFCLEAHFTSATDTNLIVVKNTNVEIYTLVEPDLYKNDSSLTSSQTSSRVPRGTNGINSSAARLVLHEAYSLYGKVADIKVLRLPTHSRDCLVVAFAEAKIVVIEWDQTRNKVSTVSMHYFEDRRDKVSNHRMFLCVCVCVRLSSLLVYVCVYACLCVCVCLCLGLSVTVHARMHVYLLTSHFQSTTLPLFTRPPIPRPPPHPSPIQNQTLLQQHALSQEVFHPTIAVDPDNRCFAVHVFNRELLVFPITLPKHHSEASVVRSDSDFKTKCSVCIEEPYVIDLTTFDFFLLQDFCFMHGYLQPTLCLLAETDPTWPGRYAVRHNTKSLLTINVLLEKGSSSHSTITTVSELPHSLYALAPVSPPLGGVLVIGTNAILHFNNQNIDYGLSLNAFGDMEHERQVHVQESPIVIAGDAASWAFISPLELMFCDNTGSLLLFELVPQGQAIRHISVSREQTAVRPSCMCSIGFKHFFVGSAVSDCLLIQYSRRKKKLKSSSSRSRKRKRVTEAPVTPLRTNKAVSRTAAAAGDASTTDTTAEIASNEDDLEAALFGDSASTPAQDGPKTKRIKLKSDAKRSASKPRQVDDEEDELTAILFGGAISEDDDDDDDDDDAGEDQTNEDVAGAADDEMVESLFPAVSGPVDTTVKMQADADTDAVKDEAKDDEKDEQDQQANESANEPKQDNPEVDVEMSESAAAAPAAEPTEEKKQQDSTGGDDDKVTPVDTTTAAADDGDVDIVADIDTEASASAEQTSAKKEKKVSPFAQSKYTYQVCDRLMVVAPIIDTAIGISPKARSDEAEASGGPELRRFLEYIACSGHDKSGTLAIMNQGVLAEVRTSHAFQRRCTGCWALQCPDTTDNNGQVIEYDDLLLISTKASSMILRAGATLDRLNESQFFTHGPTVYASNMLGSKFIVQVHRAGVRLMSGEKMLQDFPITDEHVADAAAEGIYLSLLLDDGTMRLLVLDPEQSLLKLSVFPLAVPKQRGGVSAMCFYRDDPVSGLFDCAAPEDDTKRVVDDIAGLADALTGEDGLAKALFGANGIDTGLGFTIASTQHVDKVDETELERALFGSVTVDARMEDESGDNVSDDDESMSAPSSAAHSVASVYCTVVRTSGHLEVYRMPECTLLFWCDNFPAGYELLVNAKASEELVPDSESMTTSNGVNDSSTLSQTGNDELDIEDFIHTSVVSVTEMCMTRLGTDSSLPYLLVFLSNSDLLVYRTFRFVESADAIPLRLSKVHHSIIFRPLMSEVQARSDAYRAKLMAQLQKARAEADAAMDDSKTAASGSSSAASTSSAALLKKKKRKPFRLWRGGRRLVPFHNISNRTGVIVAGSRPAWIFGERDFFRMHEMVVEERVVQRSGTSGTVTDHGVACVTPFHHHGSEYGFVYFDMHGTMNISEIPEPHQVSYDARLPVRRVHLGHTPHVVAYHAAASVYAVAISKYVEAQKMEYMPRSIPLYDEEYEVLLFDPRTWEVRGRYDSFQPHELVLSLKAADTVIRHSGEPKHFLMIGTTTHNGEDSACRGRMIVLDVFWSMGMSAAGQRMRFLKVRPYSKDRRGPVSALGNMDTLLVSVEGSRLLLYEWTDRPNEKTGEGNLVGKAFYDVKYYVTSLNIMRNLILVGDIYKGLQFIVWDHMTLTMMNLGGDYSPMTLIASEFMVDGSNLNMLTCDDEQNLRSYVYDPELGGKKLLQRADFHTGSTVNRFIQLRIPGSDDKPGARDHDRKRQQQDTRLACIGGCTEGTVISVSPIPTKSYLRLYSLHTQMTYNMEHICALNPRGFRLLQTKHQHQQNAQKNIVDGSLVFMYPTLDQVLQRKLARNIGTTPQQLIDNLLEIDINTRLY
jgi:cleavage and polyadenylation specificity factor subunit 1